jgi:hypothetical protein
MQFAPKGIGFLYAIHEKSKSSRTSLQTEENFRKQHNKLYFFCLRAATAMLPAESANCMQSSAGCNTAGKT